MRNSKWLKLLALLMAFGLVAAACSSDSDDETVADAPATEEPADEPAAEDSTLSEFAGESVSVFGPESSDEEAGAINDALAIFAERTGIDVTYTGNRDASTIINTQVAAGTPPDIFIFPQPGKLADFARNGDLLAVTGAALETANATWAESWNGFGIVDGTQYGVPIKADLKSLVWYQPDVFEAAGYTVPTTLTGLIDLTDEMIANGDTPWCIGIESGDATGWTATDWIEDIMLRTTTPENYDAWVAGELAFSSPEVTAATEMMVNEFFNKPGSVFAAGGSIAATPFGDNGQPLVDGQCFMHRQASFYASFLPEGTAFADGSAGAVDVFYFPADEGSPVLAAGTLAGAFTDSGATAEVMNYLAGAEYASNRQVAQVARKGGGASGFLSAATGQDAGIYLPLEESFISIMQNAGVGRFDGSDLMPAAVGSGTFWSEMTSIINGDISIEDGLANIDASWPS